jgi:hypothetical protein
VTPGLARVRRRQRPGADARPPVSATQRYLARRADTAPIGFRAECEQVTPAVGGRLPPRPPPRNFATNFATTPYRNRSHSITLHPKTRPRPLNEKPRAAAGFAAIGVVRPAGFEPATFGFVDHAPDGTTGRRRTASSSIREFERRPSCRWRPVPTGAFR